METTSFEATLPTHASDARWFPVDLHVPDRRFDMAMLDAGVLERSTFLDTRLDATLASVEPIAADRFAMLPQRTPAWLFHTSFCGSTLLARAAHLPAHHVALKEPLVLRRLADARHAGWSIDGLCDIAVRLLSRPWTPDGDVLVKATHAALNIAPDLLRVTPDSRAVLLTSTLDDFLVSNLKKTPETQAKVPELAERALRAGTLHARLPAQALQPPDLLCAVALQWAAQRDLLAGLVRGFGERVRVLDFATLADDPENVVVACARWWRWSSPENALRERTREVAHRNAKAMAVEYSAQQREQEARMVQARFGTELARARDWAERFVLPYLGTPLPMQPPQEWT
ncbi:hypothetical protein [Lysobacter auxotrophicus]|uniref:Sulfotransferase n=1 Tax=Lysobacter auxotrophicus TaxID=2992573 RepID=A0ABM8DGN3_9GAMM|nr:hypothetical protein [Lysobacter auxotrophicus]BDU17758.1 sulfotransferase [Lysobacter auxotrophicus]